MDFITETNRESFTSWDKDIGAPSNFPLSYDRAFRNGKLHMYTLVQKPHLPEGPITLPSRELPLEWPLVTSRGSSSTSLMCTPALYSYAAPGHINVRTLLKAR